VSEQESDIIENPQNCDPSIKSKEVFENAGESYTFAFIPAVTAAAAE
jgi:hypothetical protein